MGGGIFLALLLGFQGARGILVLYGPLFGTELLRSFILFLQRRKREREDILITVWTFAMLLASFWGNSFSFSVEQSLSRNIRNGLGKLWKRVVPDMADMLWSDGAPLISQILMGILAILSLAEMTRILWRVLQSVRTGKERRRESERGEITAAEWAGLAMGFSPFLTALIVAFTTMESTGRYYFMLIYAIAFFTVLFLQKQWMKAPFANWPCVDGKMRRLICGTLLLLTLLHIQQIYVPVLRSGEPPWTEEYQTVRFLEENHYAMAYATFENANTMTVLANGRVRVAPVASVSGMDICKWLSSSEWYVPALPYHSATAYVITEAQMDEFGSFLEGKAEELKEIGRIGRYRIYGADYNYSVSGQE